MPSGPQGTTYLPGGDREERQLLDCLGAGSWEEVISHIPEDCLLDGPTGLGPRLSELEVLEAQRARAARNQDLCRITSFLGGGAYDHWVPTVVDRLLLRSELMTCYTPYQPEVSQGTLQATFEYQTSICSLTGMDVANASLYDGASAAAEAVLMFTRKANGGRVLVSGGLNPRYLQVLRTYLGALGIELDALPPSGALPLDTIQRRARGCVCAVVQNPNFFGSVEPMDHVTELLNREGVPLIAVVNPISLALLKPPGEYGAAVAVGEGQPLGNHPSFGGPLLGFMACREALVRQMPGRIVGMTRDAHGRRGFVLTLQTREQHIRRARATSNICTNQGLNAVAASIYLSLLGPDGLEAVARACFDKAHYAADRAVDAGLQLPHGRRFFMEFVVQLPGPADAVVKALPRAGLLPGIDLGRFYPDMRDCLLVAVTEKRSREQIDRWAELVGGFRW
jgi:glycine dehydrogenase subunit 1